MTKTSEVAEAALIWILQMRSQKKSSEATAWNDPPNYGTNSLAKRCGIVGKIGRPRARKSLSTNIQIKPNESPWPSKWKFLSPDCHYIENLGPSLLVLSTRREEATESFRGRCSNWGGSDRHKKAKESLHSWRLPSSAVSDIKKWKWNNNGVFITRTLYYITDCLKLLHIFSICGRINKRWV